MRLTCPNCGARYEVADTMIPPDGRDVQCSNCSTTWFQPGRRSDLHPTVRVARGAARTEAAGTGAGPAAAPPDPAAEVPRQTDPAPPGPQAKAEPPAPEAEPGADAAPRREMDPAVRDILREEAEREARLRRGEADPVETQAEMPLDEDPDSPGRARHRAELDSAEDAFAVGTAAASARDLFPDIDEINSTLRDTGDRSSGDADASDIDTLEAAPRRRRGTRTGFVLAIALAAGAAGLYGNAERLSGMVPAAAPALERYAGAVDAARVWLDGLAQRVGSSVGDG
jgi:predicted Zn finger-like uncharacterized protein